MGENIEAASTIDNLLKQGEGIEKRMNGLLLVVYFFGSAALTLLVMALIKALISL